MAKKELTKLEHNDAVWAEVKKLEDKIKEIKLTLHPAELAKQANLNDCNKLARKANIKPVKVDPKRYQLKKAFSFKVLLSSLASRGFLLPRIRL